MISDDLRSNYALTPCYKQKIKIEEFVEKLFSFLCYPLHAQFWLYVLHQREGGVNKQEFSCLVLTDRLAAC